MKDYTENECERLVLFSRQIFSNFLSCLLMAVFSCAVLNFYKFPSNERYTIGIFAVFSLLASLAGLAIFLASGGTRTHYPWLVVFIVILYPFCILALYVSGTLVYFAATMHSARSSIPLPKPMWLFSVLATTDTLCAIATIYTTLCFPSMKIFLKEFQKMAKSKYVWLPNFLFMKKTDYQHLAV